MPDTEVRVSSTVSSKEHPPILDHRDAAADQDDHDPHEHGEDRGRDWLRVGFVAAVILLVWSGVVPRFHGIDLLAVAGILIGGFPIFKEAIADLLKGRMTMELSMTIALVAASAIGEFFTALLITVFVLIAEIIEGMTVGRGRGAIRQLLDLLPQTVEVRSQGEVSPRDLSDVRVGDVVLVRPGGHHSRGWRGGQRPFFRRSGHHHGRVDAGGKDSRLPRVRGNHQSIRRSGNPRGQDRAATRRSGASSNWSSGRNTPAPRLRRSRIAWRVTWCISRWPARH